MTDDNFHKLALSESFKRVAKVAKEREAFRQEVSDVMTYIKALYPTLPRNFNRFIIPAPKPDPLVEVMKDLSWDEETAAEEWANDLRAALEARGLEIVEVKNDD